MTTQTNQPTWASHLNRVALALGGCLIAAIGCGAILYVYAFASMISPEIAGWDRWTTILRKMFFTPSVVVVVFGIFAAGFGIATIAFSVAPAFGNKIPHVRTFALMTACFILFLAALFIVSL